MEGTEAKEEFMRDVDCNVKLWAVVI